MSLETDPFLWLVRCGFLFPLVRKLGLVVLPLYGGSVENERVWKALGRVFKDRGRLNIANGVDQLLVKKWWQQQKEIPELRRNKKKKKKKWETPGKPLERHPRKTPGSGTAKKNPGFQFLVETRPTPDSRFHYQSGLFF